MSHLINGQIIYEQYSILIEYYNKLNKLSIKSDLVESLSYFQRMVKKFVIPNDCLFNYIRYNTYLLSMEDRLNLYDFLIATNLAIKEILIINEDSLNEDSNEDSNEDLIKNLIYSVQDTCTIIPFLTENLNN